MRLGPPWEPKKRKPNNNPLKIKLMATGEVKMSRVHENAMIELLSQGARRKRRSGKISRK